MVLQVVECLIRISYTSSLSSTQTRLDIGGIGIVSS